LPPSIDVVIPVHGNYELTSACLRCLAAQSAQHTVIVVDDGSLDDTASRLRTEWPQVRVLELAGNRGYTYAVNRGVEHGEGQHVVLLNNDVELEADFLERVVQPLLKDPRAGSAASLMLEPGGQTIDSAGVSADATLAGFARLRGRPATVALDPGPVLTGPEGTAGAYRRAAWEEVGGLDERIEAYMEILDLALRLRAAGWLATFASDAVGVHLGSRTYGAGSRRQRRLAGFSRGYLLRRYGVLRSAAGPRAALTEAIVITADAALNRDAEALRGRLSGWRAAGGLPRRTFPPREAIDGSTTLLRSLALRRRTAAR